jgi:hypothetical protein
MGDSAYPFLRWLQKGFPRSGTSANVRKRKYNALFSGTRVVVECAYGKLKGQWRCLLYGLRVRSTSQWNTIVEACVILHNITIDEMGQGFVGKLRRFRDSPAAFARDPNQVGNATVGTVQAPHAAPYREELFRKLVPP